MKLCLLASLALLLVGCPTPAPQPPTPDADASPPVLDGAPRPAVEVACAHLAVLECPEGKDKARCIAVLEHVADTQMVWIDAECVAKAASVDAVRKCAGITCPGK